MLLSATFSNVEGRSIWILSLLFGVSTPPCFVYWPNNSRRPPLDEISIGTDATDNFFLFDEPNIFPWRHATRDSNPAETFFDSVVISLMLSFDLYSQLTNLVDFVNIPRLKLTWKWRHSGIYGYFATRCHRLMYRFPAFSNFLIYAEKRVHDSRLILYDFKLNWCNFLI